MRMRVHKIPMVALIASIGCRSEELPGGNDCLDPATCAIVEIFATPEVTPDNTAAIEFEPPAALTLVGLPTGIGDVDEDGSDDLAIAFAASGGGSAEVRVLSGAGLAADQGLGATLATITGAGTELSRGGDVDGDGQHELLVGGPDVWYLFTGAILSAGGSIGPADAQLVIQPTAGRTLRGAAGGGDVDADGLDDVIASEFVADPGGRDTEEVRVIWGADLTSRSTVVLGDAQGAYGSVVDGIGESSIALLGDMDGDGKADFATGGVRNFAAVHLGDSVSGSPALSDKEIRLHDCHPDDATCPDGTRVAAAGDVNGDGTDDLLLMGFPDPSAWVIPGADIATSVYDTRWTAGELAHKVKIGLATHLASVGDMNDDGMSEILADDGAGNVWLYSGSAVRAANSTSAELPTDDASHEIYGYGTGALLGVTAGDLNGDGHADVLLVNPATGSEPGTIHILLAP